MLSRSNDLNHALAMMLEAGRRMDHVWNDVEPPWPGMLRSAWRSLGAASWPRVNLYDTGSTLVLRADVPGLTHKDLSVTLDEHRVSITGARTVTAPAGHTVHHRERGNIHFSRSLSLPCKIDPEASTAAVQNGVLTLTLAKAPEAQQRQITVRVRGDA